MKIAVLISFLLLFNSCQRGKFDKKEWAEKDSSYTYPKRKYMLNDLLVNYQLKGKSYDQIVNLLGEPLNPIKLDSSFTMTYGIDLKFKDHLLIGGKALTLKLNKDTIVQDYEIDDWKKSF